MAFTTRKSGSNGRPLTGSAVSKSGPLLQPQMPQSLHSAKSSRPPDAFPSSRFKEGKASGNIGKRLICSFQLPASSPRTLLGQSSTTIELQLLPRLQVPSRVRLLRTSHHTHSRNGRNHRTCTYHTSKVLLIVLLLSPSRLRELSRLMLNNSNRRP